MPVGVDQVLNRAEMAIKSISGISDSLQGQQSREVSGKAIQSKQFQGQVQLAGPLDNLAMTRFLVGRKLLELVQGFYTEQRLIMITDDTDVTDIKHTPLMINEVSTEGEVINDLTLGTYDVVVSTQPLQATWQENQFTQAIEMRQSGIAIPDVAIVELSSLSKKADIIKAMQAAAETPPTPVEMAKIAEMEANSRLKLALLDKTKIDATAVSVDTQLAAVTTAQTLATNAALAPVADELLHSAGYKDFNAPPIFPGANAVSLTAEMQPAPPLVAPPASPGVPPGSSPPTEAPGLRSGSMMEQMSQPMPMPMPMPPTQQGGMMNG